MTDTRARDALAAALHAVLCGCGDHGEADYGDYAAAILAHPYTPDQRRSLAAAFLDAEALEVLSNDHRKSVSEWSGNLAGHVAIRDGWLEPDPDTGWDEVEPEECAVCSILAALRETS